MGCIDHAKRHRKVKKHPLIDFKDLLLVIYQKFDPKYPKLN